MSIVCSVIGHKASTATVWNRGHHFSTCTRCRADLVESEDDRWITPPAGYRIVRKQPVLAPETRPLPACEPAECVERAEPAQTTEPAEPAQATEPAEPAEPKSVWEAVRDPEPISPLQEKRARPDRRVEQNGSLPASLAGVDRRRGDRRKSNGDFQPRRRKGLLAQ
ncbi:MAG: hypothetical protein M3N39_00760 [Pseudomonadota bacterium]|nr:hypothetical protein [Pseudomonadota bacterium]